MCCVLLVVFSCFFLLCRSGLPLVNFITACSPCELRLLLHSFLLCRAGFNLPKPPQSTLSKEVSGWTHLVDPDA